MSWVFLSGPMGAGKTTVASALAARRGDDAVELDARIEARAGRSIPELFASVGEAGFRALEREVLAEVLEGPPSVVALGGGTVVDRASRHALLEAGAVITLTAPLGELVRRVGAGEGRPLLGDDPAGALSRLLEARRDAYAECHGVLSTAEGPEAAARAAQALTARDALVVPLGVRTYRVEVSRGLRPGWTDELGAPSGAMVVTDENVDARWAEPVRRALGDGVEKVVLTPGEEHKRLEAVDRLWDAALEAGLDRDAILVAVGGGVVGDLTGFAAATLLRGVGFAALPTSLLAMVDASVGGKTGFDRAQGKNLVGAFHQPRVVVAALDTLETLPDEELRSGLAEVVKAAWLEGEGAVAALERDAEALLARDPEATARAVRRAIRLKIRVVARDEREAGLRRLLNLGHTVGHAMEAAGGYTTLKHGEAVGLGMLAAFDVAASLGDARAAAHRARLERLLARLSLPTELTAHLGPGVGERLWHDKKRAGDDVRFVVPGEPGACSVERVPLSALARLFGAG